MIQAWYEGHTETPVTVTTGAELDAVLDDVVKAGAPQLVQFLTEGDVRKPHMDVGLNGERGTLRYAGEGLPSVSYSKNTGTPYPLPEGDEVIYYLDRADFYYPDDAEIPATDARAAAHEFLASAGARPTNVEWTDEQAPPTA
ncbi:Imm1 family immunity protein [Amycolatopsis samaneae]|uniref:Imm1 family immunity protein n=1 Tax=Amycolatopsis samaneae TaxID=664691 RepID=A0ABW5GBX6_9PSEU